MVFPAIEPHYRHWTLVGVERTPSERLTFCNTGKDRACVAPGAGGGLLSCGAVRRVGLPAFTRWPLCRRPGTYNGELFFLSGSRRYSCGALSPAAHATAFSGLCCPLFFDVLPYGRNALRAQHAIVQERAHLLATSRNPVLPPYAPQKSRYFAPEALADADVDWVRSPMLEYYGLDSLAVRRQWQSPALCQRVGKNLITVNRSTRDNVLRLTARLETDADAADEILVFYEGAPLSPLAMARWLLRFVPAPLTHFWRDDQGGENWCIAYADLDSRVLHVGKELDIVTAHGLARDIKFFALGRKNSAKRRFIKADLTACEPGEGYAP